MGCFKLDILENLEPKLTVISKNSTSKKVRIVDFLTTKKGVEDYYPFGMVMSGRNGGENYTFGFQGQLQNNEIKGKGNSVNYKYRMHDPRLGRFFAVDPLTSKYPFYSPYTFSGNRVIDMVELEGLEPTASEAAGMAADVYDASGTGLTGGWEISAQQIEGVQMKDANTGFKSSLYERTVDGVTEYSYVTAGTDMTSGLDWENNINQATVGKAKQYEQSVNNARLIDEALGGASLTFVGHSLGGGEASANALATGRDAITFNAAGLSQPTRDNLKLNMTAKIDAYIVKGEVVDATQGLIGIKAEYTNLYELSSTQYQISIFGYEPLKKYNSVMDHMMESVIKSMKRNGVK